MIRLCLLFLQALVTQVAPKVVAQDADASEICSLLSDSPAPRNFKAEKWEVFASKDRKLSSIDSFGLAFINRYCLTKNGKGVMWEISIPTLGIMYLFSEKERSRVASGLTPAGHVQLVTREFMDLILGWVASTSTAGKSAKYKHLAWSENYRQVLDALRDKYGNDQLIVYLNAPDSGGRVHCIQANLAEIEQYYRNLETPTPPSTYDDVSENSTLAYVEENESEDSEQQYPVFLPRADRLPSVKTVQTEHTWAKPLRMTAITSSPITGGPAWYRQEEDPEEKARRNARRAAEKGEALSREERKATQRLVELENEKLVKVFQKPRITVESFRIAAAYKEWDKIQAYWNSSVIKDEDRNNVFKKAVEHARRGNIDEGIGSIGEGSDTQNALKFVKGHVDDPRITVDTKIDIYRNVMGVEGRRDQDHPLLKILRPHIPQQIIAKQEAPYIAERARAEENLRLAIEWLRESGRQETERAVAAIARALDFMESEREREERDRWVRGVPTAEMARIIAESPAHEVHNYALTTKENIFSVVNRYVNDKKLAILSYQQVSAAIERKLKELLQKKIEEDRSHQQEIRKRFAKKVKQLNRNMKQKDETGLCIMWAWVNSKHPDQVSVWLDLWLDESARAYDSAKSGSCDAGFPERIATAARGLNDPQIAEIVRPAEEILSLKVKFSNLGPDPKSNNWINRLAELGGAKSLKEAKAKIKEWWEKQSKWVNENKGKLGKEDKKWLEEKSSDLVSSTLDYIDEGAIQEFLDKVGKRKLEIMRQQREALLKKVENQPVN